MTNKPTNVLEAKQYTVETVLRWRDAIMQAKRWNGKQWAELAMIDPTIIRRNMSKEYGSTTKLENMHLLAKAAGVPSVVDFLSAQADDLGSDAPAAIDADIIAKLMAFAMHVSPSDHSRLAEIEVYAHGVAAGLRRIARAPSKKDSLDYLEAVGQDVQDAVESARASPLKQA